MRRIRFPGLLAESRLVSGIDGATAVKLAWERERYLHDGGFPGKAEDIKQILEQDFVISESPQEVSYTLKSS